MESWDVVVVGGGPAALRAAIASADAGSSPLMIDSRGTGAASGDAPTAGLAASIEETDSSEHLEDTITAGGESVNEEAASRICSKAVSTLAELEKWGLVLRRTDAGLPHASEAPGHTKPRMTGCGDSTLREVTRILEEQAIKRAIPRRTDIVPISLVMDNQQVRGIVSLDLMSGNIVSIQAKAIILATEGHQGMWSDPSQGSGSGAALAAQAGVGLAGMAHTPRHALTMSGTGLKLPFDLLGSGGRLRRGDGEDVGPEVVLDGEECVLDLRFLEPEAAVWFTQTSRRVKDRAGLDISMDVIPLSSAIADTTGGAPVDEHGRVTFDNGSMWFTGLYAAGRSAHTGMHGSGLLPGNLLLEDLVGGNSAGEHAGGWATQANFASSSSIENASKEAEAQIEALSSNSGDPVSRVSNSLSSIMSAVNGSREQSSLSKAAEDLSSLRESGMVLTDKSRIMNTELATALQLQGMLTLAESIVGAED